MSSNKIVLNSSDGETFEIDEAVARKMQVIAHMIEDDCADKPIPLENITGKILALVIEYCKKHVDDHDDSDSIWDAEFMRIIDAGTILKLMIAANYLNIKGLIYLTIDTVADKKEEELVEIFKNENDTPSEELAKVHQENAWAFEDI